MATYGLGREQNFYLVKEGSLKNNYGLDSQVEFAAATNSAKVLSSTMDFSVAREDRMDSRASRSVLERITGKQEVTWSCETYMLPRGGSDVPNIGPLIECAMGSVSTVTYSLADALPSLQMARVLPGVIREELFGCWVEEMTVTASGAEPIKMSFSGGACEYALTGSGTSANTGSGASALVVGTNEAFNFTAGSRITIADGGVAAGVIVAGSSSATAVALATTYSWATSKAITPHVPAGTIGTHGNPTSGITGSVSVNGSTLTVTGFEVTMTNNIKPLSDEYGTKGSTDFIPGFRSVTGSVTVRAEKDDIKALARRYQAPGQIIADGVPTFATVAIILTLGETDDKKQVITLPTCELDFGSIDVPESEEAVLNIPFTALGASTGNNEFTFEWNNG
tara:strand:+ start:11147 stop:12331 length:1185 start_codon:yes stop_codon:yes gene_type:complete